MVWHNEHEEYPIAHEWQHLLTYLLNLIHKVDIQIMDKKEYLPHDNIYFQKTNQDEMVDHMK